MRSRSRDCGSLLVALKLRQPKSWCTLKALTARPAAMTNKLTRTNTSSQRGLSTPPGRMRASTALKTKVQLAPVTLHCSCDLRLMTGYCEERISLQLEPTVKLPKEPLC